MTANPANELEKQDDMEHVQASLHEVQALLSDLKSGPDGQRGAELRAKLAEMEPTLIARILEALSQDESLHVWELVAQDRHAEILDDLSDVVSEALSASVAPQRKAIAMSAFELRNGRLRQIPIERRTDLETAKPIWIDMIAPTETERDWVEEIFGLTLPDMNDLTDLEESARFYIKEESGDVHLLSGFLLDKEDESRTITVAFILSKGILFTMRDEELPIFRLQRLRARIQPGYVSEGMDVLLDLYDADVEYSADALEDVYVELETVGRKVLSTYMTDEEAGALLADIAQEEDLNGRIRRNVLDTRRALSFLMRGRMLTPQQHEEARQILRDIESIDGHTAFIFNKINFLMDAVVGFININQNKIIKIFSVASVAMLPPTLIASIYGMNFKVFPELEWQYGYPLALALMAVSVAFPMWFFRKKGWLR